MFETIISIVAGLVVSAILWLFKNNVSLNTDVAVLKEKAKASEEAHKEFKTATNDLREAVHELRIVIETLKSQHD